MKTAITLIAALLLAGAAQAHEVTHGTLEVIHPNIPLPPKSAKAAAGYMAIANEGTASDHLIGIETSIAQSAQVHTTEHLPDGVARMVHVPMVELPAGDTVVLEPGGLHLMLMGLTAPLAEGDMIPVTLIFEKAGKVEVEFMVDPANEAEAGAKHHQH